MRDKKYYELEARYNETKRELVLAIERLERQVVQDLEDYFDVVKRGLRVWIFAEAVHGAFQDIWADFHDQVVTLESAAACPDCGSIRPLKEFRR